MLIQHTASAATMNLVYVSTRFAQIAAQTALIHCVELCTGVSVTEKATQTEIFCKKQWSPQTYTASQFLIKIHVRKPCNKRAAFIFPLFSHNVHCVLNLGSVFFFFFFTSMKLQQKLIMEPVLKTSRDLKSDKYEPCLRLTTALLTCHQNQLLQNENLGNFVEKLR